jgi:hypothetical protein
MARRGGHLDGLTVMRRPTRSPTLPALGANTHKERGAALIVVLLSTLLLSAGAVAMIRWSAILLHAERDQNLRFEVLRTLIGVLDTGVWVHRPGATGESAAVQAMAGNTMIRISVQDQRSGPAGNPAPGVYRSITATWEGPHGTPQHLVVHTFWHPSRRIY